MYDFLWFGVFVAVNAFVVTLLALFVSYRRISLRVANGDGGKLEMKQAIRAHANAVEHTAIFGFIVLALSVLSAPLPVQAVLVIGFSAGRVLHGVSMLNSAFNLRRLAAIVTYAAELLGILSVIYALIASL